MVGVQGREGIGNVLSDCGSNDFAWSAPGCESIEDDDGVCGFLFRDELVPDSFTIVVKFVLAHFPPLSQVIYDTTF